MNTKSKPTDPLRKPSESAPQQLIDLNRRVKALEEAVFPPGGPTFGVQLAELQDAMTQLKHGLKELDLRAGQQDEKIRKVIEVFGKIEETVSQLVAAASRSRTMTA